MAEKRTETGLAAVLWRAAAHDSRNGVYFARGDGGADGVGGHYGGWPLARVILHVGHAGTAQGPPPTEWR